MDKKKDKILLSAMELITLHGFHGMPMSMLAKHAGVAAGTIYHHFKSKEDLINQLYTHLKEKFGSALKNGIDNQKGQSIEDRFWLMWQNAYYFFSSNPAEFRFLEQYANSPFIDKAVKDANEMHYKVAIDLFYEGQKAGVFRNMPLELMTNMVYGTIVATAKTHLNDELRIDVTTLEQAIRSSWDSMKSDKSNH